MRQQITDQLFAHINGLGGRKEVAADVVAYRHDGPETSVDAAYAAKPRSGAQRERVYQYIANHVTGGATADEVSIGLDLPAQSVSARIYSLAKDGAIKDTGYVRKTRYGRNAAVWTAWVAA